MISAQEWLAEVLPGRTDTLHPLHDKPELQVMKDSVLVLPSYKTAVNAIQRFSFQ